MKSALLDPFCTPSFQKPTNSDIKAISTAKLSHVDFEGSNIPIYSWGEEGRKILLVHGWGSKASHVSLLARIIVKAGFQAITFDMPAHSSSSNSQQKALSNMFEFGRSISAVAKHICDIDTIIGHSLGGLSTVFTVTGYLKFKEYKIDCHNIVLISAPTSMEQIISSYTRIHSLSETQIKNLSESLETEFDFQISDYCASKTLTEFNGKLLIIQDRDDIEVPPHNADTISQYSNNSNIYWTDKLGHQKILFNRDVFKEITTFLKQENEQS